MTKKEYLDAMEEYSLNITCLECRRRNAHKRYNEAREEYLKQETQDEPIDYGYSDNCAQNMGTMFRETEL